MLIERKENVDIHCFKSFKLRYMILLCQWFALLKLDNDTSKVNETNEVNELNGPGRQSYSRESTRARATSIFLRFQNVQRLAQPTITLSHISSRPTLLNIARSLPSFSNNSVLQFSQRVTENNPFHNATTYYLNT